MTAVKICGITNEDDARFAIKNGADFIGFIFAPSKRRIIKETAKRIIDANPDFNQFVGVFYNGKKKEIEQICEFTGIKIIQLHGDESPAFCNYFIKRGYIVIKAFRVENHDSLRNITKYEKVHYLLFDTYVEKQIGGTGTVFDWEILKTYDGLKGRKYILSGGLDEINAKKAIRSLKPFGVDASSRLELRDGVKNQNKVKVFLDIIKKKNNA